MILAFRLFIFLVLSSSYTDLQLGMLTSSDSQRSKLKIQYDDTQLLFIKILFSTLMKALCQMWQKSDDLSPSPTLCDHWRSKHVFWTICLFKKFNPLAITYNLSYK